MKNLKDIISEKLIINKNIKVNNTTKYHPKDKEKLKEIIENEIKRQGNEANLNNIDTSNITDMSSLFAKTEFNGNISNWDVSNVKNMNMMFYSDKKFTGENTDFSNWKLNSLEDTGLMFSESGFKGGNGISNWDVSNIKNMRYMFQKCVNFNDDLSKWDVSNVTSMQGMFSYCKYFNCDLSNWDVHNVKHFNNMFNYCENFTGDGLKKWNTESSHGMGYMFAHTKKFNEDISNWKTGDVVNMEGMFEDSIFNQDISKWDVKNVGAIDNIFKNNKQIYQNLSSWFIPKVKSKNNMFMGTKMTSKRSWWPRKYKL